MHLTFLFGCVLRRFTWYAMKHKSTKNEWKERFVQSARKVLCGGQLDHSSVELSFGPGAPVRRCDVVVRQEETK